MRMSTRRRSLGKGNSSTETARDAKTKLEAKGQIWSDISNDVLNTAEKSLEKDVVGWSVWVRMKEVDKARTLGAVTRPPVRAERSRVYWKGGQIAVVTMDMRVIEQ